VFFLHRIFFVAFFFSATVGLPFGMQSAKAETVTKNGFVLSVTQSQHFEIALDVRAISGKEIKQVEIRHKKDLLKLKIKSKYAGKTAIFFVIDTSNPKRADVVAKNVEQIGKMISLGGDNLQFGLAVFDSDLKIIAPIGSSKSDLSSGLQNISAKGLTTELYRSVKKASELLATVDAQRKFLFLFSDGRAEDKAYGHQDVITAATKFGVNIISFGFAKRISQQVYLQSLRRLAEESGGFYYAADNDFELPAALMSNPFARPNSGLTARFELTPVQVIANTNALDLAVTLTMPEGNIQIPIKVSLLAPGVEITVLKVLESLLSPANFNSVAPYITKKNLLIFGGAVIVLLLLIFIFIRRLSRAKEIAAEILSPIAFFEFLDKDGTKFEMVSSAVNLGRNHDNDVVLNNDSISGHHAQIQRQRDGGFIATDLNSLNGVSINGEKVDVGQVIDGDVVEMGEVRFKFITAGDSPK
jgi:hypothetical protein